ncbi:MAG: hypothetical protein QM315_01430 [Bacillota bacterium]|jgi:hypothetical protein|nr:hypothetical protein [Bacillota bacterium]
MLKGNNKLSSAQVAIIAAVITVIGDFIALMAALAAQFISENNIS